MISLFLTGLLATIATIVIISVLIVSGKWLKNYIAGKLKNKEKHKVAFADTREVVNEYIKNKEDNSEEISMDDLEKMCAATPYVSALVDENGNIQDYEGINSGETNENFKARLKQQKGMIVVGV